MNKFIVGACAGVFSLAASQYATAQTAPVKPAAKRVPVKRKVTKKAESAAAAKPEGVQWKCELGNELHVAGDMTCDQIIKLHRKGKSYDLPRQPTRIGTDRYLDQETGFDLVVTPVRAILFNRNEGHCLVDECQTAEAAAGAPAPTQAGALHASVGLLLMTPDSPAPALALAPGTAQPAQQ